MCHTVEQLLHNCPYFYDWQGQEIQSLFTCSTNPNRTAVLTTPNGQRIISFAKSSHFNQGKMSLCSSQLKAATYLKVGQREFS